LRLKGEIATHHCSLCLGPRTLRLIPVFVVFVPITVAGQRWNRTTFRLTLQRKTFSTSSNSREWSGMNTAPPSFRR